MIPWRVCVRDLDDKVSLDTLRDHGFREVVLLDPYLTLCRIGRVIGWYRFGAIDNMPHFARLERILHSNRPYVIILLVLEPVCFSLRKDLRRRG